MSRTHCCRPAAFVVMPPTGEHHQPDESHDEAEDGDEHHPALRVLWHHQRARHQDPHQTAEDLQEDQRQEGHSADMNPLTLTSGHPSVVHPEFFSADQTSCCQSEAGVWDFCLPLVAIRLLFSFFPPSLPKVQVMMKASAVCGLNIEALNCRLNKTDFQRPGGFPLLWITWECSLRMEQHVHTEISICELSEIHCSHEALDHFR